MSDRAIPIKKAIPIIAITWIISLVTTLAVVSVAPNIFPISDDAVTTQKIADSAITTTKLADGTVTSAKILDGTITAVDLTDGAIVTTKIADGAIITTNLADGNVTSAKILDGTITSEDLDTGAVTTYKIADYAVTNAKLASDAIPFASKVVTTEDSTTSTDFEDMPDTSVSITLDREYSQLLILFSCEAANPDPSHRISARALVGTKEAYPSIVSLTPRDRVSYGSYTRIFFSENVAAGTYIVKMQWGVDGSEGYVCLRTLTVIALPA